MGLIVNFSDFENISAAGLGSEDYLIGYRPGPNREIRMTISEFFSFFQAATGNSTYVIVKSNSASWNSAYSTVNSLSDTWEESIFITPLQAASGSWNSAYSTVNSLSDTWEESVYITPLQAASASWNSAYSTVNSLSDTWEESVYITPLQAASASWNSVYNSVQNTSGNWDNTYITTGANSGHWEETYNFVIDGKSYWDEAYTNLVTNSAAYLLSGNEVNLGDIPTLSASWNSVYSTTQTNSSTWTNAYTNLINNSSAYLSAISLGDIPTLSASWNSVYSTFNANSSRYTTLDYLSTKNVLLSAATITGNISATGRVNTIGITQNIIPVVAGLSALNMLGPNGLSALVYTPPIGYRFIAADYFVATTVKIGSNGGGATAGTFNLLDSAYKNLANSVASSSFNDIDTVVKGTLSNTTRTSTTTGVFIVMTTAPSGGSGNTITALSATVLVTGNLIPITTTF